MIFLRKQEFLVLVTFSQKCQSLFLRCSSTLDDIGSCNRIEVNRPKTPAYQANQGLQKCFSWSHLVKNMTLCGTAMILR